MIVRNRRSTIARFLVATTMGAVALLGVPACSSTDRSETPIDVVPSTVTIRIADGMFEPRAVEVRSGGTVHWINDDVNPHQFESVPTGTLESPVIAPTETWNFDAATTGEIRYYDTFRPTMKGTITVR